MDFGIVKRVWATFAAPAFVGFVASTSDWGWHGGGGKTNLYDVSYADKDEDAYIVKVNVSDSEYGSFGWLVDFDDVEDSSNLWLAVLAKVGEERRSLVEPVKFLQNKAPKSTLPENLFFFVHNFYNPVGFLVDKSDLSEQNFVPKLIQIRMSIAIEE